MVSSSLRSLFFPLLAALSLVGCTGETDKGALVDADEDGYTEDVDCDETNPAIHPGAEEVCDDVDNDCDYATDNNPTDGRTFYADVDSDTYGDPDSATAACSRPTGFVTDATDCDDGDPAVNTAAIEVCDDIDNDCNGTVDDSTQGDGAIWYADADDDGYGDLNTTMASCTQPDGYVDNTDDCDDTNAGVSPEADEYCDTIDNDCDSFTDEGDAVDATEWYLDADEDTYGDAGAVSRACTQPTLFVADDTDCDDDNASAYPGATEEWHDSDDYDCDGKNDPIEIWVSLEGAASSDRLGTAIAGAVDIDGDGMDDVLVGATGIDDGAMSGGGAYLFLSSDALDAGGTPLDLEYADGLLTGVASSDGAGSALAGLPDLDGDGYGDVLVGATGEDSGASAAGAVYVMSGTTIMDGGTVSLGDAELLITGINTSDAVGSALAALDDIDGDGLSDAVVGVYQFDRTGSGSGSAWILFSGDTLGRSGETSLSGQGVRFDAEGSNDRGGYAVAGAGDVDGDGLGDVAVGAPNDDTENTSGGEAYVLLGDSIADGNDLSDTEADLAYSGTNSSEYAGWSVAGGRDMNGDGLDDVVVGGYGYNSSAGIAWVLLSNGALRTEGAYSLSTTADLRVEGVTASDQVGYAVAMLDDKDGDTLDEAMFGANGEDTAASGAGAVFFLTGDTMLSSVGGSITTADCDIKFEGSAASDGAGAVLADLGDINGDGLPDIGIGAPSATSGSSAYSGGLAWLLRF